MRRREFIFLLGGAAASWPLVASAQQPALPVIGYLDGASADGRAPFIAALRQGLAAGGYVEGQNIAIEYRFAGNQFDKLPAMAAELVSRQVTLIAAGGNGAARAAKSATSSIPIVFGVGDDPVKIGLVPSLSRPGGNMTGMTPLNLELAPKRVELLHELLPAPNLIAVLLNPNNSNLEVQSKELQAAARSLGLQLSILYAGPEADLDAVFATVANLYAAGLVIGADAFFNSQMDQLATMSVRHRVPTIYQDRLFAAAGGLMSYGGSVTDLFRQVGMYAARILKGEKPADLPVMQSTKVELFINLKTANALGIAFPLTLLGRADEVIE
jgi:putative tryptophan/tyrosine transport system substrate-binding protein